MDRFLSIISGFSLPFVLKAVVDLEIPEVLAKSDKPLHFKDIAREIEGSNSDLLKRYLTYLASKKLLDEASPGCFSLNDFSRYLLKDNPASLAPVVRWITSEPMIASWQALRSVALESNPGAEPSPFGIGNNATDLFEFIRRGTAEGKVVVDGLRHGFGEYSASTMDVVMEHYDGFKSVDKLVVDCGGGNGVCGGRIVKAYPHLKVINYDIPQVQRFARPIPGVEHVPGDMFKSVPCGDAIFIKQVLHNWNDEKCRSVLRNCHKALPDKGKLIIVDMIEPDVDVDMFMFILGAGKERSKDEWLSLLTSEGFSDIKFNRLPGVTEGVIEAFKATKPV